MNKKLPLKEAARILGVSRDTLRRWEKRGVIKSERTPGGHRRFDISEVKFAKSKRKIQIPKTVAIRIIGNPITPRKPGIITRLICFVVISYSLIFIAENPVVLADAIKGKPIPSVLGVQTTGASAVTFGSTLDTNFNLTLKGVINAGGVSGLTYNAFANSGQIAKSTAVSSSNDLFIGGDLEVAGTINPGGFLTGSIPFINSAGALAQDNSNLFYNSTAKSLGVGTFSPASKLGVLGNAAIGATYGTLAAPTSGLLVEGKVGIGTTTPNTKLSLGTDTAVQKLAVYDGTADFYGLGAINGRLAISAGNAEKISITNSGNIGIGTTNPGFPLSISSSVGAGNAQVSIADTNSSTKTLYFGGQWLTGWPTLGTNAAYNLSFATNNVNRMTIDSSGNVGIGTSSPLDKLDVRGSLRVNNSFQIGNTGNSLAFNRNTDTGSIFSSGGFAYQFNHTNSTTNTSDFLALQVYNTGGGTVTTSGLVINGAGLIGIGTTSPTSLLHITGAVTGKALAIFNETGDQALLTASASGVAKFTIQRNGLVDASANGIATNVNAGAISDSTYGSDTPVNGLLGVDSTDGRLYFRYSGAWHYVAQTAGFQIPNYETFAYDFTSKSFDKTKPLADGDFLIPFVEKHMDDGAIHGLYARLSDVADRIFKAVELVVKRLRTGKITIIDDTVGNGSIPKDTTEIEIKNSNVNESSLIYITPTSPTNDKVLYVKEKKEGSFKVGFSDSISIDTTFNWWIIEKGK